MRPPLPKRACHMKSSCSPERDRNARACLRFGSFRTRWLSLVTLHVVHEGMAPATLRHAPAASSNSANRPTIVCNGAGKPPTIRSVAFRSREPGAHAIFRRLSRRAQGAFSYAVARKPRHARATSVGKATAIRESPARSRTSSRKVMASAPVDAQDSFRADRRNRPAIPTAARPDRLSATSQPPRRPCVRNSGTPRPRVGSDRRERRCAPRP